MTVTFFFSACADELPLEKHTQTFISVDKRDHS